MTISGTFLKTSDTRLMTSAFDFDEPMRLKLSVKTSRCWSIVILKVKALNPKKTPSKRKLPFCPHNAPKYF